LKKFNPKNMIFPKMTHTISTVAKNWHSGSFSQKKVTHYKKNYGATNFSVFHDFFIIPSEFLTYPKIKNPRTIRLVWLIFELFGLN
jgi:hypothetical protein